MPKVSVIIPVYGVENYIERCARSLFSQTLDKIEFIFIDDCSRDRSMELLLATIKENKPHIIEKGWTVQTEKMPKNSGQAAVRKRGIELASGEYVIQCDSDDWVASDMYEVLYNKALRENADIVICRACYTDGVHHRYNVDVSYSEAKITHMKLMLTNKASNSLCLKLIKRSIFIDNPIKYPIANYFEDGTLSLQAIYYSHKHLFINKHYYYYYNNSQSITKKSGITMSVKCMEAIRTNVNICENFLRAEHLEEEFRNAIACVKFNSSLKLIGALEDEHARMLFKESISGINFRGFLTNDISLKNKLRYIYYYLKISLRFFHKDVSTRSIYQQS